MRTQGIALLGTVIGFEGRVVFHAFGQYIKLPPPWDWITVTACMLGVAGIMLAAQLGVLGSTLDVTVAGARRAGCAQLATPHPVERLDGSAPHRACRTPVTRRVVACMGCAEAA